MIMVLRQIMSTVAVSMWWEDTSCPGINLTAGDQVDHTFGKFG